jgi:Flp pilus assembly protein TadD
LSAEQWEKAADEFQHAIRLHRYFTDAHYALGAAYMGMRRYASAALAFQGCLEATWALHTFAERERAEVDRLLDDQIREVAEAARRIAGTGSQLRIDQLERRVEERRMLRPAIALAYQPPPRVLLALGSAHFRNGDIGRAEYYWREAVRIDSSVGEAWNNLAAVYAATGRKDEAETAIVNAEHVGFRLNPRLKVEIRR